MQMIAEHAAAKNSRTAIITNRRSLFSQTSESIAETVDHAGIASGYGHMEDRHSSTQLIMLQTYLSRLKAGEKPLEFDLVIWDEAHLQTSGQAAELFRAQQAAGARQIGFTATPVAMGHLYQSMVTLCTNSQLRAVGGMVPFDLRLCREVSMDGVDKSQGRFNVAEEERRFANHIVFGNVIDSWMEFNPFRRPSILFAPSIPSSRWFVDQFRHAGVPSAHIDGKEIYYGRINGEPQVVSAKDPEERRRLAEASRSGEIPVVCNRFVLREGINWPWLEHGIFACAVTSLAAFIQMAGRISRAYTGKVEACLQDHGGNVFRLADPNIDIPWHQSWTNSKLINAIRNKQEAGEIEHTPVMCPKCRKGIGYRDWKVDKQCPYCKHTFARAVREIVQLDGKVEKINSHQVEQIAERRKKHAPQNAWNRYYWQARRSTSSRPNTFNQLRGRFHREYPQYRIIENAGKTCIRNLVDNSLTYLRNAPKPDSVEWQLAVRFVNHRDLQ